MTGRPVSGFEYPSPVSRARFPEQQPEYEWHHKRVDAFGAIMRKAVGSAHAAEPTALS